MATPACSSEVYRRPASIEVSLGDTVRSMPEWPTVKAMYQKNETDRQTDRQNTEATHPWEQTVKFEAASQSPLSPRAESS